MSIWFEDDKSESGLGCNHIPQCIFCQQNPKAKSADMDIYDIKLLNFSLDRLGKKHREKNSYAIDVVMYCPRCGWQKTYGVAVSKEHGLKAREFFHELERRNREREERKRNAEEKKTK